MTDINITPAGIKAELESMNIGTPQFLGVSASFVIYCISALPEIADRIAELEAQRDAALQALDGCLTTKEVADIVYQRDAALSQLATARAERAQIESGLAELFAEMADYFAPLADAHPKVAEAVAAMRAAIMGETTSPATGDTGAQIDYVALEIERAELEKDIAKSPAGAAVNARGERLNGINHVLADKPKGE